MAEAWHCDPDGACEEDDEWLGGYTGQWRGLLTTKSSRLRHISLRVQALSTRTCSSCISVVSSTCTRPQFLDHKGTASTRVLQAAFTARVLYNCDNYNASTWACHFCMHQRVYHERSRRPDAQWLKVYMTGARNPAKVIPSRNLHIRQAQLVQDVTSAKYRRPHAGPPAGSGAADTPR
ncbi:unnamed protein product [Alternaria burnsii]|nr:unnamed protein product [Alternaria burnsii]